MFCCHNSIPYVVMVKLCYLYQNRQKHCLMVEDAILNMVRAVSFLDTGAAAEATIDFDDSIIEDSNATIDKNIKLVSLYKSKGKRSS